MSPSADTRRPENLALLFQDVLTAIVRLRANRQGLTDANAFRHHTREAIKTAASQALAAGYTADDTRQATPTPLVVARRQALPPPSPRGNQARGQPGPGRRLHRGRHPPGDLRRRRLSG